MWRKGAPCLLLTGLSTSAIPIIFHYVSADYQHLIFAKLYLPSSPTMLQKINSPQKTCAAPHHSAKILAIQPLGSVRIQHIYGVQYRVYVTLLIYPISINITRNGCEPLSVWGKVNHQPCQSSIFDMEPTKQGK